MEIHGLNTEGVERAAKLVRLSTRGRESKELSGSNTASVLRDRRTFDASVANLSVNPFANPTTSLSPENRPAKIK